MEEINLKEFLFYLKKYLFVIITITVLLVGGIIFYDINIKTKLYTTYTTIVLVKNDSNNNVSVNTETIDQNDIVLNQKLVSTYRQIIKSKLVIKQVISLLSLNYGYEQLSRKVSVEALENTEILKISVSDVDPKVAARIANTIAFVFEKEVTSIYNINNVSVIDVAEIPTAPSNSHLTRDIVAAIAIGCMLSMGTIFIIFYFDDRLRYSENIEEEINMPIIAKVFKDYSNKELIANETPNAITSECIRNLRTNLQFSSIDTELKAVLVTSTVPGEGKSYISANLAISFAQTGKKVLLIDCDLRKGRQHEIFNIKNNKGLSNMLIDSNSDKLEYFYKTKIKNLFITPRGTCPPNPSELLNSGKNAKFIELAKEQFDIIILDGAPCSGLSDSLILGSLVDEVILISSDNYTPKTELKNVKKSLENVGAKIAGCVINNIRRNDLMHKKGYYGYNYSYGYVYGNKPKTKEKNK